VSPLLKYARQLAIANSELQCTAMMVARWAKATG
jgi:hypothetical protein